MALTADFINQRDIGGFSWSGDFRLNNRSGLSGFFGSSKLGLDRRQTFTRTDILLVHQQQLFVSLLCCEQITALLSSHGLIVECITLGLRGGILGKEEECGCNQEGCPKCKITNVRTHRIGLALPVDEGGVVEEGGVIKGGDTDLGVAVGGVEFFDFVSPAGAMTNVSVRVLGPLRGLGVKVLSTVTEPA